jgi:xanthine dehydrogenase accessory factor
MKSEILNRILEDKRAKTSVVLATRLDDGAQTLIYRDHADGGFEPSEATRAAAAAATQDDKSGTVETDQGRIFFEVFNPPQRMIIVGGVHIAQPLARMAGVAGYEVIVVDPRGAFATAERFPGVTLVVEWPDEAIPRLDPDRRTAVVTLTHDPKIDDPALQSVLRSEAFYIGALGSRRTHAGRLERLREAGFSDEEMARIHGPVGLSIGATSPAEIAVSILAQITDVLHRKDAA